MSKAGTEDAMSDEAAVAELGRQLLELLRNRSATNTELPLLSERADYPFAGKVPPPPNTTSDKDANALSDEQQLGETHRAPRPAPSWTISGTDPLAPTLVKHWAELSKFNKDVEPWERERARRLALAMERWQQDQGMVP